MSNSVGLSNNRRTLLVYGKISKKDFEVIEHAFAPTGIEVSRPLNKADLVDETLRLVFSDFSVVSYIRDGLITAAQAQILHSVYKYLINRRKIDRQVSFDKTISHGNKIFTILITCDYAHIDTIENQIAIILTDAVLDKCPNGSRFFVTGQDDMSIKVSVIERGSGKQYPLN